MIDLYVIHMCILNIYLKSPKAMKAYCSLDEGGL